MLTDELTDFLFCAAYNSVVRAGAKIEEIYTQYDDFFVRLKADNTPLTIADRQAHAIISEHLSLTRIPLLSEEGRDLFFEERKGWDLFWLVDPLDGTEEFIKRNGEFTVNVALMVENQPFFGVIFVPMSKTIYFSHPRFGAMCKTNVKPEIFSNLNLEEILSGIRQMPFHDIPVDRIRVAISRSHESSTVCNYLSALEQKYGHIETFEYGSSFKFCLIAEGSAEIYIRTTPTMEWDTAAGHAIAHAAGAKIRTLDGEPLKYNKESLTNPPFVCSVIE